MTAPFDACLLPLGRLATRFPEIEGQVVWWDQGDWQAQDDAEAMLDAEEIAFYAEGLLAEGFGFCWQALAEAGTPARPVLVRLYFWQGAAPPPPLPGQGWVILAEGRQRAG